MYLAYFDQVTTLHKLLQACHRLLVRTAERSGDVSGAVLEGAVASFGTAKTAAEKSHSVGHTDDFMKISLEMNGITDPSTTTSLSATPSPAFMMLDLDMLSRGDSAGIEVEDVVSKEERKEEMDSGSVGVFSETVLAFVRDHLVSKPLLMAIAAVDEERKGDGNGSVGGEQIQEGFLLLCEVRCCEVPNFYFYRRHGTRSSMCEGLIVGSCFSVLIVFHGLG